MKSLLLRVLDFFTRKLLSRQNEYYFYFSTLEQMLSEEYKGGRCVYKFHDSNVEFIELGRGIATVHLTGKYRNTVVLYDGKVCRFFRSGL